MTSHKFTPPFFPGAMFCMSIAIAIPYMLDITFGLNKPPQRMLQAMFTCSSSTHLHESGHPMIDATIEKSLAAQPQNLSPRTSSDYDFWQDQRAGGALLHDQFGSLKLGQAVMCTAFFGMEKFVAVKSSHPSDTCRFRDLVAIGKAFYTRGDYESSMAHYREALRIKKDTINQESTSVQALYADVLDDIAFIQSYRDPVRSIQAYHLCIELRRSCLAPGDPLLGKTLYMLASVYFAVGMGSEALDHLLHALLVLEDDRDDARAFDLWMAIGSVQSHLGDVEDSDSSFEEAARVLSRLRVVDPCLDAVSMMARITRCRGNMCVTPEDLNDAIAFFCSVAEEPVNNVEGTTVTALAA